MEDRETIAKDLKQRCIHLILDNVYRASVIDLTVLKTMNPDIALDILLEHQEKEKKGTAPSPQPTLLASSSSGTSSNAGTVDNSGTLAAASPSTKKKGKCF
jgi:hypothetical protein